MKTIKYKRKIEIPYSTRRRWKVDNKLRTYTFTVKKDD